MEGKPTRKSLEEAGSVQLKFVKTLRRAEVPDLDRFDEGREDDFSPPVDQQHTPDQCHIRADRGDGRGLCVQGLDKVKRPVTPVWRADQDQKGRAAEEREGFRVRHRNRSAFPSQGDPGAPGLKEVRREKWKFRRACVNIHRKVPGCNSKSIVIRQGQDLLFR